MHRRSEREAFLPEATQILKDALAELSAWNRLDADEGSASSKEGEERLPPWLVEEDGVAS
jgi:hypothetical protein